MSILTCTRKLGTASRDNNIAAVHLRGPLSPLKKPSSFALLPYVQTTHSRISKILVERKIISSLGPVKDDLQLKTPGCVQPSLVSVCQVCNVQSLHRHLCDEQKRYIRVAGPDQLAVVEHI